MFPVGQQPQFSTVFKVAVQGTVSWQVAVMVTGVPQMQLGSTCAVQVLPVITAPAKTDEPGQAIVTLMALLAQFAIVPLTVTKVPVVPMGTATIEAGLIAIVHI